MTGDKHRDLGGGIYDDGRPEPSEPPVTRPAGQMPSCPRCGNNDNVGPAHSPHGKYLCGCMTLFDGTDREWRTWRRRREEHQARVNGEREVIKPLPKSLSEYRKRKGTS